MSDRSAIEWTDATWNPLSGCTKVSPGCENCYIVRTPPFRIQGRRFRGGPREASIGSTTGVLLHPRRLTQPLRWRKPRKVFVNSLSDMFHSAVPTTYVARIFAVMALAERSQFQVLTKRAGRMVALLSSPQFTEQVWTALLTISREQQVPIPDHLGDRLQHGGPVGQVKPLPNLWLGVSVETQQWADLRIPKLTRTPWASVRFLSCEPLLGPITIPAEHLAGIDWVIVGGESGPKARPMHDGWVRQLRVQCDTAGVPLFFKQAGAVLAREWGLKGKGADPAEWPEPFPQEWPMTSEMPPTTRTGRKTA